MCGPVAPAEAGWLLVAAVALAAAACGPSPPSRGLVGGREKDAGVDGSGDSGVLGIRPCEPTLTSLRAAVFGTSCNWEYCHGEQSPAWDLWLLAPDLEQALVGAPAGTCRGWTLVVPGHPEESFLWQKLSSDHPPCRTERMPLGLRKLPPHALSCVRGWIESLAASPGDAGATGGD